MKRLILAEMVVLFRRPTARAMLAVSAGLAFVVVFVLGGLQGSSVQFNGKPIPEIMSFSGPDAGLWALQLRHFFVMPLFLLTLAGQSVAGERSSHLMREQLVRPVSRHQMLLAKLISLWLFSVVALAVGGLVSVGLASPWLGVEGPWSQWMAGFGLSVLTDLGVLALGFVLSSFFRSTAGVVIAGLMVLGVDWGVRLGLSALGFLGIKSAVGLNEFMLGTGLNLWSSVGPDWRWSSLVALGLWVAAMLSVARFRLNRLDVP